MECPVCQKVLQLDYFNAHVNAHFEDHAEDFALAEQLQQTYNDHPNVTYEATPDIFQDNLLAIELQNKEAEDDEELKKLQDKYGLKSGSALQQMDDTLDNARRCHKVTEDFYQARKAAIQRAFQQGIEDDFVRTVGMITRIQDFLDKRDSKAVALTHKSSVLSRENLHRTHMFCLECDHFSTGPGARGFGCGYRNTQMLLSAMMRLPVYKRNVFNGRDSMPSIFQLQRLIESAWKKGFDAAGKQQLMDSLYNTRKWIGATDVATLLCSLRVRCRLVDFSKPTGKDNLHTEMFRWIYAYFSTPKPAFRTESASGKALSSTSDPLQQRDRRQHQVTNASSSEEGGCFLQSMRVCVMPLYLQYVGHSITVVGVERDPNQDGTASALWILDPGMDRREFKLASGAGGDLTDEESRGGGSRGRQRKGFGRGGPQGLLRCRRPLHAFREDQYQLVEICGGLLSDGELEKTKCIGNIAVRIV